MGGVRRNTTSNAKLSILFDILVVASLYIILID